MIKSMTGYGKSVIQLPTKKITVEIKSLNSKNLDLNTRVPSSYRGKELEIQHTTQTMFWDANGKPITSEAFLNNLFGEIPNLFKSEQELRELWSNPITRKTLLEKLETAGYGEEKLNSLRKLIDAENSDLFDVLEYVFNSDIKPITRAERVETKSLSIFDSIKSQLIFG